ncbi:Troponin C skeletal muscle [Paragonimus westermani]|uniref:Troponin C skeletal muscle n=1 Tax=Paragonimus westermani TaxID=34504 RepID=A0A8T0DW69_9TREM|nr:Troponin C skeletal muscle [Paragonimus westermani]
MDHEQEKIKKGFRLFDPNNIGSIQTAELGNLFRWLKLIPTNAQIQALCAQLDPNKTGLIRAPFVYNAIASMWPSQPAELETKAWQAFLTFDKLDRGKVSSEEMRKILTTSGLEPLPENEVKKILKQNADPKDGSIEYGTLIRMWLK